MLASDKCSKYPLLYSGWAAMSGLFYSIPGFAHSTERGLVLLLPTELYVVGGAIAVLTSFLLLAAIPASKVEGWFAVSLDEKKLRPTSILPSLITFFVLMSLVISGLVGTRDPLTNPLVIFIWTLWWVIFTVVQCLTGDLWRTINPWNGVSLLMRRCFGLKSRYLDLSQSLGYWLALGFFAVFAWFELVYLSPQDPAHLAWAVMIYWFVHFVGSMIFGTSNWLSKAEPFSIFFRLIGGLSPFGSKRRVVFPGTRLVQLPALPLSGVLFVLITLSSVSYDGFARTFLWLSVIDVNPLAFPGRSAVWLENTVGLFAAFLTLSAIYYVCTYFGFRLAGAQGRFSEFAGRAVYSILPISLVFHCAHYFTQVLVNTQYAVLAFNDPFSRHWNWLSLDHFHVTTSFLNNIETVAWIWRFQTAVIVIGHIIGIVIAHAISLRVFRRNHEAIKSQIALAVLMVGYTVFGLWLLSTPSIG